MTTFGSILSRNKGGPGFNTLRLLLSISILCFHSVLTAYGPTVESRLWDGPAGGVFRSLMPVFFALSGFLVMGSAVRSRSVGTFILLRGIRIVPALAAEISLSALVLGAAFTDLPLARYFTDKGFLGYFGSVVGRVRVALPGIFPANPMPGIMNTSLWTIPPELMCYVFLAMAIIAGIYAGRRLMTMVCVGLFALSLYADLAVAGQQSITVVPVKILVLSFVVGTVFHLWRDRIPSHPALFTACLLVGVVAINRPVWIYLALPALTYCVVYVGCTRLPDIPVLSRGDYSYGIYLYAFPVQQAVVALLPGLRQWYWNIAICLPLVVGLAMLSWHFVERPALRLRKRLTEQPAVPMRLPTAFAALAGLAGYAMFLGLDSGTIVHAGTPVGTALRLVAAVVLIACLGTMARVIVRRRHPAPIAAEAGEAVVKPA